MKTHTPACIAPEHLDEWQADWEEPDGPPDDLYEACGSCGNCGVDIYPEDIMGLCQQCEWWAEQ